MQKEVDQVNQDKINERLREARLQYSKLMDNPSKFNCWRSSVMGLVRGGYYDNYFDAQEAVLGYFAKTERLTSIEESLNSYKRMQESFGNLKDIRSYRTSDV